MRDALPSVLKTRYVIHSYEVDTQGRARPAVLLGYMLDSAWNHVKSTPFSFTSLEAEGRLWAASKVLMVFDRFPKWNDEVVVETWAKGIDRFYAIRDFRILSESSEVLVATTSSWVIIDRDTFRPQKMDKLQADFPFRNGEHALNQKLERIPALGAVSSADDSCPNDQAHRYRVRYTDLDINRHVIASRYVRWILDSIPEKLVSNRMLRSLQLNFLAEAKLGDAIRVALEPKDDSYVGSIQRESDGRELLRARLMWST
jgi:acyl-ACP thioesterase